MRSRPRGGSRALPLAHGFGVLPVFDPQTGAEFSGRDDVYAQRLEQHGASSPSLATMTDAQRVSAAVSDPNLHWLGPLANAHAASLLTAGVAQGHLRMHAPNPLQSGSSVAHVSSSVAPNDFMEPFYAGPNHDPRLALALLRDIGWRGTTPTAVPAAGRLGGSAIWLELLFVSFAYTGLVWRPVRRDVAHAS